MNCRPRTQLKKLLPKSLRNKSKADFAGIAKTENPAGYSRAGFFVVCSSGQETDRCVTLCREAREQGEAGVKPILDFVLKKFIQVGVLRVTFSDDTVHIYRGIKPGLEAELHLKTKQAERSLVINSGLAFGEEYMAGELSPEGCTLETLMRVLMANIMEGGHVFEEIEDRLRYFARPLKGLNSLKKSRRNVAHHYDLNGRLYDLFLDKDRQYSCAYFAQDDMTLEEAQAAKKRHIASKLKLDRPGLEVLDIGCGWGGLAQKLAKDYGATVVGITLSKE